MAEKNPPVWMQSGTYSAAEDRMVTGMLSSRSLDPATGTTRGQVDGGVVGGLDQMRVTAMGSNLSVQVSAGAVVVPAGSSPPGAYLCYNDGQVTLTLDAETSGNPRADLIVAEVIDAANDPEAVSLWRIRAVKGNAGPSPLPPNPSGYQFPLGVVVVKPAALNGGVNKVSAGDVTDVRRFNVAQGGVHVKWPSLPYPPASPGRIVYQVAGKKLQISHGVEGDWADVYTQSDWKSVLSAMGALQATHAATVDRAVPDTWTAQPQEGGKADKAIEPITRTGVRAPNNRLKITVSGLGKVEELTSSGHLSAEVRQGGNVVWEANFLFGPSFYTKSWSHGSMTFLAHSLPATSDLTVRVMFARRGEAGGKANFKNVVLMVEPTF